MDSSEESSEEEEKIESSEAAKAAQLGNSKKGEKEKTPRLEEVITLTPDEEDSLEELSASVVRLNTMLNKSMSTTHAARKEMVRKKQETAKLLELNNLSPDRALSSNN